MFSILIYRLQTYWIISIIIIRLSNLWLRRLSHHSSLLLRHYPLRSHLSLKSLTLLLICLKLFIIIINYFHLIVLVRLLLFHKILLSRYLTLWHLILDKWSILNLLTLKHLLLLWRLHKHLWLIILGLKRHLRSKLTNRLRLLKVILWNLR